MSFKLIFPCIVVKVEQRVKENEGSLNYGYKNVNYIQKLAPVGKFSVFYP